MEKGKGSELVVISVFGSNNQRIFVLTLSEITLCLQVHNVIPVPLSQTVNPVNSQCEHFFKVRKDQNANKADTFADGF